MPKRYLHIIVHLDANRINALRRLPHMNTLEKWFSAEVILLEMCETSQDEASAGSSRVRARKAGAYLYSMTCADTPEEKRKYSDIEKALFPEGTRSRSERNDVDIVFNAWKYAAILVTEDGGSKRQPRGILGAREDLQKLGVSVMTDEEAVKVIRAKIAERDELARSAAQETGEGLPDWVGKD